jgi:hypothetical protein
MFRQLALLLAPPPAPGATAVSPAVAQPAAERVFNYHPIQISRFLEEVWAARNTNLTISPSDLEIPLDVPQLGLERDSGVSVPRWISVVGATAGKFTLAFTPPGTPTPPPQVTAALDLNETAANVQAALAGLPGIGAGNVTAVGGPLPQPISITFPSTFNSRNITADGTGLTGPTGTTPRVLVTQYPPNIWDHLIYAYMIENTRVYEIFRRVLEEYAYGERLGFPSDLSQRWLRATEQLFYRDNPPFQIYSLGSWIRPDIRAVRRNAYHRMFGLDLNHGTDDNRPYPYPRAAAANAEFTGTFEELLREVWRAIENVRNAVGPNQTDITTIANLARTLFDMLRARRQDGNLTRDELFHVSTMDWFHLTLSFNVPIVVDLKAEAPSAAERLEKIGERVGLPAHSRSDSYFHLAENMSLVLRELELGTFNDPTRATALFQTGAFQDAMQQIITHWSIATGRDVKVRPVTIAPPQPAPVRPMPRPIVPVTPTTNGRMTASREPIPI